MSVQGKNVVWKLIATLCNLFIIFDKIQINKYNLLQYLN